MVNLSEVEQSEIKVRGWEMGEMLKSIGYTPTKVSKCGKSVSTLYNHFNCGYGGEKVLKPYDFYGFIGFVERTGTKRMLNDMARRLDEIRRNGEFDEEYEKVFLHKPEGAV
jgi:hypothetical protein